MWARRNGANIGGILEFQGCVPVFSKSGNQGNSSPVSGKELLVERWCFNAPYFSFLCYTRTVIHMRGLWNTIKRTQLGGGLKLKHKFLGHYKVVKINPHDRYDVAKVGSHEGPAATSTSADHMKSWFNAVAT
ncbi:hypothetical protein AVEN_25328-1 [Araneus ventricosus]|uniref:Uncharacterized protein n=1 Tax=Araneus ventricosus TaxID=182803 RepID=A0A4Y2EHZ1_ARAVE|nr:hypothetical protein AVEN_25328-1 [Araneus ventricosus]